MYWHRQGYEHSILIYKNFTYLDRVYGTIIHKSEVQPCNCFHAEPCRWNQIPVNLWRMWYAREEQLDRRLACQTRGILHVRKLERCRVKVKVHDIVNFLLARLRGFICLYISNLMCVLCNPKCGMDICTCRNTKGQIM